MYVEEFTISFQPYLKCNSVPLDIYQMSTKLLHNGDGLGFTLGVNYPFFFDFYYSTVIRNLAIG